MRLGAYRRCLEAIISHLPDDYADILAACVAEYNGYLANHRPLDEWEVRWEMEEAASTEEQRDPFSASGALSSVLRTEQDVQDSVSREDALGSKVRALQKDISRFVWGARPGTRGRLYHETAAGFLQRPLNGTMLILPHYARLLPRICCSLKLQLSAAETAARDNRTQCQSAMKAPPVKLYRTAHEPHSEVIEALHCKVILLTFGTEPETTFPHRNLIVFDVVSLFTPFAPIFASGGRLLPRGNRFPKFKCRGRSSANLLPSQPGSLPPFETPRNP